MARHLTALLLGLVVVLGLAAVRMADPYPVRVARETSFDLFQQIKPREAPPNLPIRIVDIDELSLAQVGHWPWPRAIMALLAERLVNLGASAVVLDILFSEAERFDDGAGDAALVSAIASGPTILSLAQSGSALPVTTAPRAGLAMVGENPAAALPELGGAAQPLPALVAVASGLGVASLDRQGAGVARRLPLFWRTEAGAMPALSVEALRVALGASGLVLFGSDDGGAVESVRIGDITVPTGPTGELWLYYRPLPEETYIPAMDILGDNFAALQDLIEGHIVLVGSSASGLHDIRVGALGDPVPGVSIHVQAIEQMLTQTFLDRADWVSGLEFLLLILVGLAIVLAVVFAGPMVGLTASLLAALGHVVFSWWSFSGPGLLIDPSYPLFAALLTYALMAFFRFTVTDFDRRRIRRAFGHYVEPSILAQIEADEKLLRLGGNVRELTVMFSDIRNFSALAERTEPQALVDILNGLFAALGGAILRHRGTIDKFMGDSVMAFWNAPVEEKDHAVLAARAALAMRDALQQRNIGAPETIHIGIGIATGPALVGNMGFEQRYNYSCVGDTVNVASRIEGACRSVGYSILVTAETASRTPSFAYLEGGRVSLKGMSEPEPVFLLVGDEVLAQSDAFRQLSVAHAQLLAALRAKTPHGLLVAQCESLAPVVHSELPGFYACLQQRVSDFSEVRQHRAQLQPLQ